MSDKDKILKDAQADFKRHKWEMFADEPRSVAAEEGGVVIPGCRACRKRINTLDEFFRHQSDDVLPVILREAFRVAEGLKNDVSLSSWATRC